MQQQLLTHAIRNVWCSPDQDKQLILNLKRVTKVGGVRGTFALHWQQYNLPTSGDRYHIYPVGQNSIQRFNIPDDRNVWHNLAVLCNLRKLQTDIYNSLGVRFNSSKAWVMVTANNNIVIAVQAQDVSASISADELYIRFRTSAYFSSTRSDHLPVHIRMQGLRVEINNEQLGLQANYLRDREKEGLAYIFHNGWLVDNVLPADVVLGDYIEYVYDSSITEVVSIPLRDLQTYRSSLDRNRKYLVHLPKSVESINYRDDVDFFLRHTGSDGKRRGRYLHQNHISSCRMVTHRDYGISTDLIQEYITEIPGWTLDNVELVAHVKESGYDRALVNEHSRIRELYRLDDEAIVEALVGINSSMPEWKASELESSSYTRIMRAEYATITAPEVINAYGYNAIAKLAVNGFTPVSRNNLKLPIGLMEFSTILEYDSEGLLLGWYHHISGEIYTTRNYKCAYIEGYPGLGDESNLLVASNGEHALNPNYGYRFYTAVHANGVRKSDWTDVTGDPSKYTLLDNSIKWRVDPAGLMGAYNSTANFFLKEYTLTDTNKFIYEINLNNSPAFKDTEGVDKGQLLVWLNGRSLQPNLDYVEHEGYIVITNKAYMNPGASQRVLVICLDRPAEQIHDFGFVARDQLSLNSEYNVRDDKVVRCVVDGRVRDLSKMALEENSPIVTAPNVVNGKPYSIRSVPVPLHGVAPFNAYILQERSHAMDLKVEGFLTQRLPKQTYELPVEIVEKYVVYSPVCAKILADFRYNLVSLPDMAMGDQAVEEFMQRYMHLLPVDPCRLGLDSRFVTIASHRYPTRVDITSKEYMMLNRVVELYLRNKVDVSKDIRIVE